MSKVSASSTNSDAVNLMGWTIVYNEEALISIVQPGDSSVFQFSGSKFQEVISSDNEGDLKIEPWMYEIHNLKIDGSIMENNHSDDFDISTNEDQFHNTLNVTQMDPEPRLESWMFEIHNLKIDGSVRENTNSDDTGISFSKDQFLKSLNFLEPDPEPEIESWMLDPQK